MTTARSKGTWGREDPKEAEELNRLCADFWTKLEVPPEWKFMGWKNAVDPITGVIHSVGKIFRDQRTSGKNLMHYRVCFHTFSTRGGICEKAIEDYGKYKYTSVVRNKTIEKLNEWIKDKYSTSPNPSKGGEQEGGEQETEIDENDGLQHFRDRFRD